MNSTIGVLVADDELGMRETLADILTVSGYHVSSASDGDSALAAIRREPFDVVVMDIKMPGRDGVSVLREVGSPPPQVILMTAYLNETQAQEAAQAHPFAVISKPFHVEHLLGLVADAAEAA